MNNQRTAASEPRRQSLQDGSSLAALSHVHYRTAARIHTEAAWQSQVLNIAAVVGAQNVPYSTLVQRASEIMFKGAVYEIERDGLLITMGASLLDHGGFAPIDAKPLEPAS